MQKLEALRLLEVKLAAIEQDRETELEAGAALGDEVDARAEARALTAILDFLENFKVKPSASLLRLFRRYLRGAKHYGTLPEQHRVARSRAS
jgi:hypothetical protein